MALYHAPCRSCSDQSSISGASALATDSSAKTAACRCLPVGRSWLARLPFRSYVPTPVGFGTVSFMAGKNGAIGSSARGCLLKKFPFSMRLGLNSRKTA